MKLIFSILCIGFSLIVQTQNTLIGKVTTSDSTPLEGVDIYAPNLHRGVITTSDGTYVFKNLPNGTIKLVFAFVGYKSVVRSIKFDQKEIILNIFLEESVFEIDEIIVSTPFNKLQSENVMKVEHRTVKQLQRQGAISLIEGISTIAGVSQISTGSGIGKPVIRGLSGNRVLVYTQGVRLENQQFGDEHGLGLNDIGVESVEVIKGPASLLYGSDALGGVLYFNPEKFATSNTQVSSFSEKYYTNTIGTNTAFQFKASAEKVKFLTSVSYSTHSDYKVPNGDRVTNSRFNEFDVKSGLGLDLNKFSSELRFNFNTSKIGIPEEIGTQTTSKSLVLPYQKIGNYILSAHNHFYFDTSKLDVNVGYIANNRKEFEDEGLPENAFEPALHMKLKTFNYDVKFHLPKGNSFESIIGIQGLTQNNINFGEEILIPNARVNDFGAFTTASMNWDDHYLQGGLRFDIRNIKTKEHLVDDRIFNPINKTYNSFTASIGYKTTLFKLIESRLNFATGFRAPNLAELSSNGVHEGTNRFEIGSANLKNEQNYQLDLALEYKNEHIEFFANAFYNAINDYIFISPTGTVIEANDVFIYVQDDAKLYGGEFGFHWHPHPLDWLHLESSFEMVLGEQDNKDYLPLIPANTLKNTLRTEFTIKDWLQNAFVSLKLESTFKQDKISPFETETNAYNLLHFSLGGTIKLSKIKFDINLNMNNLLDTEYISHLSRLKTNGIQNMGRTFVAGINFDI